MNIQILLALTASLAIASLSAMTPARIDYEYPFFNERTGHFEIRALDGEKPIGHIYYASNSEAWKLIQLWVDAGYRKKGIGTTLIKDFLEHARRRDCRKIVLEAEQIDLTGPTLTAVTTFYQKRFRQFLPNPIMEMQPYEDQRRKYIYMSINLR
jgi:GNAT superfamily N-acetyltransferase